MALALLMGRLKLSEVPFMLRKIAILFVQFSAFSVWAASEGSPVCEPTYKPVYKTCISSKSPTVVKDVDTDWILVNRGAKVVSESLCAEHIATYAADNPKASNIRFKEIEARMNAGTVLSRGLGKSDVYCRFTVSLPTLEPIASEECGVQSIERTVCGEGISVDFIKKCLALTTNTLSEAWIKGSCLIDSFRQAPSVSGLDRDTFSQIEFQLDMQGKAYAASTNEEYKALGRYLMQNTR